MIWIRMSIIRSGTTFSPNLFLSLFFFGTRLLLLLEAFESVITVHAATATTSRMGAGSSSSSGSGASSQNILNQAPEPQLVFTEQELRQRLTAEQFAVTQRDLTERAFTGEYYKNSETGMYQCVVCGTQLFSSDSKFDSGSGWPSFTDPEVAESVALIQDNSMGVRRVEVRCRKCGAHLGHVFSDGPAPSGQRYCINSASLNFHSQTQEEELQQKQQGQEQEQEQQDPQQQEEKQQQRQESAAALPVEDPLPRSADTDVNSVPKQELCVELRSLVSCLPTHLLH